MKTNVSIKFNSIEEYREIESKLVEMGYKEDDYNIYPEESGQYVSIYNDLTFLTLPFEGSNKSKVYNSLQEFLDDK